MTNILNHNVCVDTDDRLSPYIILKMLTLVWLVKKSLKELAYHECRTVVVNTKHWYDPSQMCGRIQK